MSLDYHGAIRPSPPDAVSKSSPCEGNFAILSETRLTYREARSNGGNIERSRDETRQEFSVS